MEPRPKIDLIDLAAHSSRDMFQ